MSQRLVKLALFVVIASTTWVARATEPGMTPTETAAEYLSAMEAADLDAAALLFTEESSIFESGGVEGSWQDYRDHHLGPEIDAIDSFVISRGEATEEKSLDGSMAFVAWPIEYRIELADERIIESRGTVTFVLERNEDRYKIRHLHWSSRRKPADTE